DAPKRIGIPAARRRAAFRRGAEFLQMDVANARFIERARKLTLGKSGPARGSNRAGVDQQFDLRALEFTENGGRLCLLVADCEERPRLRRFHLGSGLGPDFGFRPGFHFTLSISAMAAAGARILASYEIKIDVARLLFRRSLGDARQILRLAALC